MSRIHDALAKARREGSFPAARPDPARERQTAGPRPVMEIEATPRAATPRARDRGSVSLRQLPEGELRSARFSAQALAVLARSYEEIERFCALERGPALGPEAGPARTVLVAGLDRGGNPAAVALALSATLVEKTKSRVLLVDGDAVSRGVARLCQTDPEAPGLWDLMSQKSDLGRCVFRTELAGLYVLPAGGSPAAGDGALTDGSLEDTLTLLLEHFQFVVLHAGSILEDPHAGALARLADAGLLVAGDPETALQNAKERLSFYNLPLRVIEHGP